MCASRQRCLICSGGESVSEGQGQRILLATLFSLRSGSLRRWTRTSLRIIGREL